MPHLSQEVVNGVPLPSLAMGKVRRIGRREVYKGGITLGALWMIGSVAVTAFEDAPTSIDNKNFWGGTAQIGYNAVINHPYRFVTGTASLVGDALRQEGIEVDVSSDGVQVDRTPSVVSSTLEQPTASTVSGLNPQSNPSLGVETTVAPVESGTLTTYTLTADNGIWGVTREVCGIPLGTENSRVAAIYKAANFIGNEGLIAGTTVQLDCAIQG